MILGAEIGLLILGLYGLASGKLTLSKGRVVRGAAARLLALVALLPVPLFLLVAFMIGVLAGVQGRELDAASLRGTMILIEAAIVLGCLIAVYAIGWPLAGPLDAKTEDERLLSHRARRRSPQEEPPSALLEPPPAVSGMVSFHCLGCGALIQVQEEFAGRQVRCGACQTVLLAPAAAPAPVPPPPVDALPEPWADAPALKHAVTELPYVRPAPPPHAGLKNRPPTPQPAGRGYLLLALLIGTLLLLGVVSLGGAFAFWRWRALEAERDRAEAFPAAAPFDPNVPRQVEQERAQRNREEALRQQADQRQQAAEQRARAEATSRAEAEQQLRLAEAKRAQEQQRHQLAQERLQAETNRRLYVTLLARADLEYRAGARARAAQALHDCPESVRGWEWRYLSQLCNPQGLRVGTHAGPINSVAFSPDGKFIATVGHREAPRLGPRGQRLQSKICLVQVCDSTTGKFAFTSPPEWEPVFQIAFIPGSRLVATTGWNGHEGVIKVWDPVKGSLVKTLGKCNGLPLSLAFSPDGKYLAVGGDPRGVVKLWDVNTGAEVRTIPAKGPAAICLAFSPDGKKLAVGSGHRLIAALDAPLSIWDVDTATRLFSLAGHKGSVTGVAFSPDGNLLASAGTDNTARVWDVGVPSGDNQPAPKSRLLKAEDGEHAARGRAEGEQVQVSSVVFSKDGKRLFSGHWDRMVRIWDAMSGKLLQSRSGHDGGVTSLALSGDGERLASGGRDGMAVVADLGDHAELVSLPSRADAVTCLAFSPDGKFLSAGGKNGTVQVWDVAVRKPLFSSQGHRQPVRWVIFSPDGKRLVSLAAEQVESKPGQVDRRPGEVTIWGVAEARAMFTRPGLTAGGESVAFGPDGKRLALGGWGRRNLVYDTTTGQEVTSLHAAPPFLSFDSSANTFAATPDGKCVLGFEAGRASLLRVPAEGGPAELVKGGETPLIAGQVALDPGGRYAAAAVGPGSRSKGTVIWNTMTGEVVASLAGLELNPHLLSFSPDGQRFATVSGTEAVSVWGLGMKELLLDLRGHRRPVTAVAFSPDGLRLAAGAEDGAVLLWEAAPAPLAVLGKR